MARRSQLTTTKINQAYDTLVLLEREYYNDSTKRDLIKQLRALLTEHELFTTL